MSVLKLSVCIKNSFSIAHTRKKSNSRANLSVSVNNIFRGSQCRKSHRASCVKLLCADTDFCSETELISVCKSCRSIHIHSRRIHLVKKFLGMAVIICNDCFRMSCIITINMRDCLLYRIYGCRCYRLR